MFFLDFFSILLLAVAIPGIGVSYIIDKVQDRRIETEHNRVEKERAIWRGVLEADDDDIRWALGELKDVGFVCVMNNGDLDKTLRYYAETVGLEEDFRAIYGTDWRSHVRIEKDRVGARWMIDGFYPHEQSCVSKSLEQLLLSRRGKYRPASKGELNPNIRTIPRDHEPYAIAWYKRIEENLRASGRPDVTLYMLKDGALMEGFTFGAFLVRESDMERKW